MTPASGHVPGKYARVEHDQLAAALPALRLIKTRYIIPPLGIDVFDPSLNGLVLAEAEFEAETEMQRFQPPGYVVAEVTGDSRFTGGRLARTPRAELINWLTEYRVSLSPS
jgi:CYTH domain-containing protein